MSVFRCYELRRTAASRLVSLCILSLSLLLSACSPFSSQSQLSQSTTKQAQSSTATPSPFPSPSPTASTLLRPDFQRGMIFPRFAQNSYGASDTTWQQGVQTIKTKTGATWLEIPILFTQPTVSSTYMGPGPNTPNLDAFASGIRTAHALGYQVFFAPLEGVSTPGAWSGVIQLGSQQQEKAWFDSYWNALRPYAQVAQNNNVEQMAIGTELQWLEQNAPASLWNELIARVRSVFFGTLTYDMNWPSLNQPPQSWMKSPVLAMIGVSEYMSLTGGPVWVDPKVMPSLWRQKVITLLDAFSAQIGKRILITEIGYRNTSDTLWNPWNSQSYAPVDSGAQAAAYAATLSNTFADPRIAGVFFWGWDGVGRLAIKDQQAIQVMHKWYTAA